MLPLHILRPAGLLLPLSLPQDTVNALSYPLGFFHFRFQRKIPLVECVSLTGYAFAPILFFGRGRGRGGRATAKPDGSRRTSADGFAVKMKQTKAGGRLLNSCSPFSAAKWQRQKSRRSRIPEWRFFRTKKYYSPLTVWIGGTDIERRLFSMGRCIILES